MLQNNKLILFRISYFKILTLKVLLFGNLTFEKILPFQISLKLFTLKIDF